MSVKPEASNETTAPPPAPAAAPAVVITPPVVIGTLKFDPATNECTLTGKWAMNQADMDSKLDHLRNDCMYSGKGRLPGSFEGHFFMYQKQKVKGKVVMKNTKIVESIRTIAFEGSGDKVTIKGEGSNKYGAFNLAGSLDMPEGENEGQFTLYKHYVPKPKRKQPKKNNNARLRGPLGALQGADFSAPNMGRRSASDRKRKANSKFKESLTEPEVPLKGPLKKCDKIILVLMKGGDKNRKQMAEIFNNPVDLTKFTTYAQDIKPSRPICFMDIKRKLYKGYYDNYDFFANDVRRVFHNAFIFNREEKLGFVYQAAVELSNEFEKKMGKLHQEEVDKARQAALEKAKLDEELRRKKEEAKLRAAEKKRQEKEKDRRRREREKERKRKQKEKETEKKRKEKERQKKSSGKSKRKGRKSTGQLSAKQLQQLMAQSGGVQNQLDMMKQMEWMRNEIAQLRQGSAAGGSSGNSGSTNRKRKKPSASTPKLWDFNAKAELTEKINKLLTHDDAYMDVIMQMIQDYGNIQVDDEEEMELDIDNLNVNCLNELDKFVTKSNNDIRRKNAKERAKQRRNARRREERARKLREQQEEAEQQRMQQRQMQMQMSSNVSMFGNSAGNSNSSLLNTGAAPTNTQQNTATQPQQSTTAQPAQKQQQAYVESDEDNDEALASGATGNFDAEFETSGNDNLWSQMGTGSQNADNSASKPQAGNAGSNNFEEEEDFDAGF